MMARLLGVITLALALAAVQGPRAPAWSQTPATLAELVAEARASNPQIQAARRMAEAAAAAVPQAGALPDPMLSAGLMNVPLADPGLGSEMAMASVQLGQRLPAPGSRAAREAAARQAHAAARQRAAEVELEIVARLKTAYYETIFVDRALDVLSRNRALLADLAEVASARFAVGRTPQQDVLRAQTEITRLDEQLSSLQARRDAAIAQVNAVLQRSPAEPFEPIYPQRVRALAIESPERATFAAAALETRLGADLPTLPELQAAAERERPMLLAHGHSIEAAREEARVARAERFPDIDLMVGYGARSGHPDLLTAMVSVPLPVFAARKQRQAVVQAEHEVAAGELEHHQMVSELHAEIATRYAALVRTREQIVLLGDGVIPQARATVESAAAAYQAGTVEFAALLEAQATLFRTEIDLARQLADFGAALAALERAAGTDFSLEEDR